MSEHTAVTPHCEYFPIFVFGVKRNSNDMTDDLHAPPSPLHIYWNITLLGYQGPVPITYLRMPIRKKLHNAIFGDMTHCSQTQNEKHHAEYPCKETNYFQFPVKSESDLNFTFRPSAHGHQRQQLCARLRLRTCAKIWVTR